VEKSYRGERLGFVRELRCLVRLHAAGCRVPQLFEADADRLILRTAYVGGGVLRDLLAKQGAQLLDRHESGPSPAEDVFANRLRRTREGQRLLSAVVGRDFRAQLVEQVGRAHSAGIVLRDVKFGNIILDAAGNPWLIDFEMSRYFALRMNPLFSRLKAEDLRSISELCDPEPVAGAGSAPRWAPAVR
jgi:tRNA A-37 threonylcarbamoyl transferase component Bud32